VEIKPLRVEITEDPVVAEHREFLAPEIPVRSPAGE